MWQARIFTGGKNSCAGVAQSAIWVRGERKCVSRVPKLIPFVRQYRQRMKFDAFVDAVPWLLAARPRHRSSDARSRRNASCAPRPGNFLPTLSAFCVRWSRNSFSLARNSRSCGEIIATFSEAAGCGRGFGRRLSAPRSARCAFLPPRASRRRHDRLLDLLGIADRAGHEPALALLVVVAGIAEPDFEIVLPLADERITDHDCVTNHMQMRRLGHRLDDIEAATVLQRRHLGARRRRLRPDRYRRSPRRARCRPLPECAPTGQRRANGRRSRGRSRACRLAPRPARSEPFSIARARISTCQCASPV